MRIGRPGYWVIFDTSTRPAYYADVHSILALPRGWVYRYEYRGSQLDSAALKAATSRCGPSKAILVYAQAVDHVKRGADPSGLKAIEQMMFIPTRLARVRRVQRKASTYYFDLELGAYPDVGDDSFRQLMKRLHERRSVPWQAWVSFESSEPAKTLFNAGDLEVRWEAIVNAMLTKPNQFAGDSFWRVSKAIVGKRFWSRHSSFLAGIEGKHVALEVTTYAPEGSEVPSRHLQVSSASSDVLVLGSPSDIVIRTHTTLTLQFSAPYSAVLTTRQTVVTVRTGSTADADEWPQGPNLGLATRVRKSIPRLTVGLLSTLAGAVLGLSEIKDLVGGKAQALVLGVVAIGLFGFGTLLLSGRVSFRS